MSIAEYFETMPPGQEAAPRNYTDFFNAKYNIVSLVAYLIGVEKRHFENEHEPPKMDFYESLRQNKNARIVRNLCRIRTALERNYTKIRQEFYYNLKNLGSLPDLIPSEAVEELAADGISLIKSKPDIDQYLIAINKELSNRIGNCKPLFPDWINWEYIKPLFLMPNGLKVDGLKTAGAEYNKDRNRFPYQCYMNWPGETDGNILYCDEKFVRLLYEAHEDYFADESLVKDVGNIVLDNITTFIENSSRAIVVVDCENSDPIRLAAALSSLSRTDLSKIQKVLLFDSEYTTSGWQVLAEVAAFPIERVVVPRLNEKKSQVDMALATNTCREVYKNDVDSVILVSSDSDYWALIQTLSDVQFLVLVESEKCGRDIKQALDERGIHYCYLDDFYTGASYTIKTIAVSKYIQDHLDAAVQFNVQSLLDEAIHSTWVSMTEKERSNYYERYLRKMKINITPDGDLSLVLGD
ncbi:MAG: NYN domain-containing protein [Ruminiclostridium sp.]|nr:NYN domain-containing protein [Ruminiclostridium sp.]